MNSILIIAHAPFAHAMRQCALHVFPDCEQVIAALDGNMAAMRLCVMPRKNRR